LKTRSSWQALHRAVYAVVLLGVLPFFRMRAGKSDFTKVAVYAAVIGVLQGRRLWWRFGRSRLTSSSV
jgi:methionine sulfoxide reductase heme-binding subunit